MTGLSSKITASPAYKWWLYASIASGAFLTVADQTGTTIALPRISEELAADIPAVQWMYLIYTLCISALLLPMGRLSDMFGRRRIYCTGLAIFAFGALVAYFSTELSLLLVAKAIQGIGAAMVQANGMALMAEAFPERQRGMAIGLYMTVIGTGAIGGPVIGGLLIGAFGWRSIYLGVVIVGVAALTLSLLIVKNMSPTMGNISRGKILSFDWVGAALSAGALSSFLLAMTYSYRMGWTSAPVVVGFLTAALLLSAFVYRELTCADPMIDLTLFKIPVFSMGMTARYLAFMSGSPAYFLLPFFLIQVSGLSEAQAAFILAPGSLLMAITGPLGGRLSDRLGTKWPAVGGLCCWTAGITVLYTLEVGSNPAVVSAGMMLMGAGNGIFGSPNTVSVMSSVGSERYGVVSALVNMVRTSGNLTGIAVGTTLVVLMMSSMGFQPDLSELATVGNIEDGHGLKAAFTLGMKRAFLVGALLVGFAAAFTGFRPERPAVT